MLAQGLDGIEQLVEEPLAAQVARDGQVTAHAGVDAHDLGQLQDEAGRQVIDAEVAHVLEHVHGLRAARAGHAGDDHDVGHAVGELGAGDAVVGVCHDALHIRSAKRYACCLYSLPELRAGIRVRIRRGMR